MSPLNTDLNVNIHLHEAGWLRKLWLGYLCCVGLAVGLSAYALLATHSVDATWRGLVGFGITVLASWLLWRYTRLPDGFSIQGDLQLRAQQCIFKPTAAEPVYGRWQQHWYLPGLLAIKLHNGADTQVLWITPERTGRHDWHLLQQFLTLSRGYRN